MAESESEAETEFDEDLGYGDLLDDVDLSGPQDKPFAPWHKPRKQFVRREQWLREVVALHDEMPTKPERFEYLTLPGNDFLDVRYLHDEFLVERDQPGRFLGFNIAAHPNHPQQAESDSGLYAVKGLAHIDRDSHVVGDDFRMVGRITSPSYKLIQSRGPFHVVNIDLCDGVASQPGTPSMFDAIRTIIGIQRRTPSPSLLLLTTRIGPDQVEESVRTSFNEILLSNFQGCQPFSSAMQTHLAVGNLDELAHDHPAATEFAISFTKWLIKQCVAFGLTVSLKSVLTYRVADSSPGDDMLSLAIRLTPTLTHPTDPTGISTTGSIDPNDECAQAARVPQRVSRGRSVDAVLVENEDVRQQCIDESASLLEGAGYNPGSYRTWADSATEMS